MANKGKRIFEIQIRLTTEEQQRASKYELPLDLAIRDGHLTGDATGGIAEMVQNLTSGLNEKAGQMSMLRQLMAKHEAEAEAERESESGDDDASTPDEDKPAAD